MSDWNWEAMDRFLTKIGAPACAKKRMRQIVEGTHPKIPRRALYSNSARVLIENGLVRHAKSGVPEPTEKSWKILRRRVLQVD